MQIFKLGATSEVERGTSEVHLPTSKLNSFS